MSNPIDIVISFDTTGSMYPCLTQVRRAIRDLTSRIFREIPDIRIGIIAHGDYCDTDIYVTKHLNLTADPTAIEYFVNNVEPTYGGDYPECYELVLHEARSISWRSSAKKLLVMIGDAVPHPKAHNPNRLDWKEEVNELANIGVLVHGVQCLGVKHSSSFYQGIANATGGYHLSLDQFKEASDLILAIAYEQQSPDALEKFANQLSSSNKMTRSMSKNLSTLFKDPSKNIYKSADSRAIDPSKFQQIPVDVDTDIKSFVEEQGLPFKKGRGFYEFTKRETIQGKKEVIIIDKETGDTYTGSAAREILGLPEGVSVDISPTFDSRKYSVFVQSTSSNRKLKAGTTFLYETESM